jgi:hypothetical protein
MSGFPHSCKERMSVIYTAYGPVKERQRLAPASKPLALGDSKAFIRQH